MDSLSGDIPTSTVTLVLKQVDASKLTALQKMALDIGCPCFFERHLDDVLIEELRRIVRGIPQQHPGKPIPIGAYAQRRFSGGKDLPRSRYYTVCSDETAEGEMALHAELTEYMDCLYSGCVSANDTCSKAFRGKSGISAQAQSIILSFFDGERHPNLFTTFVRSLSTFRGGSGEIPKLPTPRRVAGGLEAYDIFIPYTVSRVTIENVLDLRERRAQAWLSETTKLPRVVDLGLARGNSFYELLPVLLAPAQGGIAYTDLIGRVLRGHKVAGLVFPSARSAHEVHYEGDVAVKHYGWNFVDYRGASHDDMLHQVFMFGQPMSLFDFARRVRFYDDGRGGWSFLGSALEKAKVIELQMMAINNETDDEIDKRRRKYEKFCETHKIINEPENRTILERQLRAAGIEEGIDDIPLMYWAMVFERPI
jgi:hypothetical protein